MILSNLKKIDYKDYKFLLISFIALAFGATSFAKKKVMVCGSIMYSSKNIVENAVNSKDQTKLVAAVKAAGLTEITK